MTEYNYSERKLKIAEFIVLHRSLFKKLFLTLLIILNVIFWGFSFWKIILDLSLIQERKEMFNLLSKNLVDFYSYWQKNKPQDLKITKIFIISAGENEYDLVALIENPNPFWFVEFDYQFSTPQGLSPLKRNFIFPKESKYLVELAYTSPQKFRTVQLNFKNLKWRRVNNFSEIYDQRFRFQISEVKYSPDEFFPKVSFKVKNQSAYSFWSIKFLVFLFS